MCGNSPKSELIFTPPRVQRINFQLIFTCAEKAQIWINFLICSMKMICPCSIWYLARLVSMYAIQSFCENLGTSFKKSSNIKFVLTQHFWHQGIIWLAAKSDFSCVETLRSRHCVAVLQTQVPKLCTDLDISLLYILILRTYSKFARKNNFIALGVCFPQPCSSAGRTFAVSRSRLQYYRRIVSFPQQKIRWNAL